jgi:uncharacterized protein (DUF697 family)
MPTALQLAEGHPDLQAAVRRAHALLKRRALVAAAASAVPLPGLDWAVDAALLSKLFPEINRLFGLTPEQISRLSPDKRERIQKATATVGTLLVGRLITKELVLRMAKTVGIRLTAQQATKYVPLAGQALSAMLGYSALRYLGEQHLKDCVQVAKAAGLRLPTPDTPSKPDSSCTPAHLA